jgi:hypothetical protein
VSEGAGRVARALHRAAARLAALGTLVAAAPAAAHAPSLPGSALAVRGSDGAWRAWWQAGRAPARWAAPLPAVAGAVRWRAVAPGIERGELALAGTGEAWRLRVQLVRVDPRVTTLRLHALVDEAGRGRPWRVDSAPATARVALNAGQFDAAGPWGWVVHEGAEWRAPGRGALAPAVVVDSAGGVRLVPPDSIAAVRAAGGVREAFQSYPALLLGDGDVPAPLRAPGRGVDVAHRDARLALGVLRDGRVLVALTRFAALGESFDAVPFGPTVPEMAALVGALGARRAVLLDGGLSGQLLVREDGGTGAGGTGAGGTGAGGARERAWRGLRAVPLGLLVEPR